MTEKELQLRLLFKENFPAYAANCLNIRTKDQGLKAFKLNRVQTYMHDRVENMRKEKGRVRVIVLKGRQEGCSTYWEGRFYWRVTHHRGVRAFILTHNQDATNNLFKMVQRFHEYCPAFMRPMDGPNNAKELEFAGLDSGYRVGTAGHSGVGRSDTIQYFHGSEVAFWPNAAEHATGVMQAIPNSEGTEVVLESTANGLGNYFHVQWQLAESGESDYEAIFLPWFWQPEYSEKVGSEGIVLSDEEFQIRDTYDLTNDQMLWRRKKIVELSASGGDGHQRFKQEYPCNAIEAFQMSGVDPYISPNLVMSARKTTGLQKIGPKIIGVDPARFGKDRTSIAIRQGRVCDYIKSYERLDTMQVAGLVHKLIKEESPDKVFVDVGGLGAGVVDRLKEMGYGSLVSGINSGQSPLDGEIYYNKRAEMWAELKKWLEDDPCMLPDIDSLHADICGPTYKFDSKTRLLMEKKEDMQKRNLRSPDEADALCLTFAMPIQNSVDLSKFINPSLRLSSKRH